MVLIIHMTAYIIFSTLILDRSIYSALAFSASRIKLY